MAVGRTPSRDFWQGRSVFLTGHTGFKGAWLASWLCSLGATVTGFSNGIPTERSLFDDLGLADRIVDNRGDVRDYAAVKRAVNEANPEIILHLAAQSLVRLSYDQPIETYTTNVMGTVHVLEAARKHERSSVVLVVTSDKCYENREWIWGYRENDAMGGHDPYSSSKGCAELVALAYGRSYMGSSPNFKVLSARAGNVIGGGDWAEDRLVPDLVRGLLLGSPVKIRNPDAIRPWQHVLEPLCGYLLLAEDAARGLPVTGEGWNFGPPPDGEVSVGKVADALCRLWPEQHGWISAGVPGQQHEAQLLRLDSTKARSRLGWRSRWDLDEALNACIEIYRSNLTGGPLRELIERQISGYLATST